MSDQVRYGDSSRLRTENGRSRRKKHGEAATVDKIQMQEDLKEIRKICDLYPLQDIFTMDETALNYKASPDSSLSYQAAR
jgi:hypothetical protein